MGGMMETERVQLCGKNAVTIKKASMNNFGMNCYYNYFEDDFWEDAGVNPKNGHVGSGKIGGQEFQRVVVAAYVLESLYTDGPAVAMLNGYIVTSQAYIGWINYLFQTQYPQKNNDPWALFEAMHDEGDTDLKSHNWGGFIRDVYGLVGYYEIKAVLTGSVVLDKVFDQLTEGGKEVKMNFFSFAKSLKMAVNRFHTENAQNSDQQLSLIVEMLRSYYEQDGRSLEVSRKYKDEDLERICLFTSLTDAPAYVIQVVSEVYDVDFWELWERVRDVAKRKGVLYDLLYEGKIPQETISVSTMDFFGVTSDDLILFWDDDKNISFSQELKTWFDDLKSRFDILMESGNVVENPLFWILDLMEYANERYYWIFTFSGFFRETMEHLNDRRILILWKIYDEMLHDPVMEEAGSVIFAPEEPEYEHDGLHDPDTPPCRQLKTYWELMNRAEKNNVNGR